MHTQSSKNFIEYEVSKAREINETIAAMVGAATRLAMSWLKTNSESVADERTLIELHLKMLQAHSDAIKSWNDERSNAVLATALAGERKCDEASPSDSSIDEASGVPAAVKERDLGANHDPRDQEVTSRLLQVGERDLQEAHCYETELREMFGFHFIDGELDSALLPALEVILYQAEGATREGLAIAALYTLIKRHPRAFGRYFGGENRPWPRPSKELQAEIDSGKPTYIEYLYDELAVAIEEEAQGSESSSVDAMLIATEPPRSENTPAVKIHEACVNDVEAQRDLPPPRYLPIEADSALRHQIAAGSTINPEHLSSLNDLKLLLTSDAEKIRVFCGTLDPELQIILECLLDVAIREIEAEHATVVGVVNVLILRMLDSCVELRRNSMPRRPRRT